MPPDTSRLSSIYADIAARCAPYRSAPPWPFLPDHPDVLQVPPDMPRILQELREQYSDDELIDAGIAERAGVVEAPQSSDIPAAGLVPRGSWAQSGELVLAVREKATHSIVLLLTNATPVSLEAAIGFAIRYAVTTPSDLPDVPPDVILVTALEDAAILWKVGIFAFAVSEVGKLTRDGVVGLVAAFGWGNDQMGLASTKPTHNLTLAGWSVRQSDNSRSAVHDEIVSTLERLQAELHLELDEVSIWCPNRETLSQLTGLRNLKMTDQIAALLNDSRNDDLCGLPETAPMEQPNTRDGSPQSAPGDRPGTPPPQKASAESPGRLTRALEDLRRAHAQEPWQRLYADDHHVRARARHRTELAIRSEIMKPLELAAEATPESAQKVALLSVSPLIALHLGRGLDLYYSLSTQDATTRAYNLSAPVWKEVRTYIDTTTKLFKLLKELEP